MRKRNAMLNDNSLRFRDERPQASDFNSWHTMNPVQRDMAFMDGSFITQSHHILLLTLEEAQQVADDLMGGVDKFFSYRAAPGNIKDGLDGFRSLSKLTTYYNSAQELVFNFRAIRIKAIEYKVGGKTYIKITGYPALRRILNGTRYGAGHPQMLEMAIGRRGLSYNITQGVRHCIYFSLAWRAIELIFKSDYDLVDFLVDISMDAAKAVVSGVVIGIFAGGLTLVSAPIIVTTFVIVALGLFLNNRLNYIDDETGLSTELKTRIRDYFRKMERRGPDYGFNSQYFYSF
ncbi:ImpA domain-containing protein [Salmonella enterica subsp. salamae]|nr:ImpA domain-containing protein [Salmonella enterica subsp. salamae]